MSTGITDWVNLSEITAIYPFQGMEGLLVLAAFVFWIWWQYRAIRDEDKEMKEAAAYYRKVGIENVMSKEGKIGKIPPK